jgi:hypothetical protein
MAREAAPLAGEGGAGDHPTLQIEESAEAAEDEAMRFALLLAISMTACAAAGDDGVVTDAADSAAKTDSAIDSATSDGGMLFEADIDDSESIDSGAIDSGAADSTMADTSVAPDTSTPVDTGSPPVDAPAGCTNSPVSSCASGVVVIGHYAGGSRTIDIAAGSTSFQLVLLSYDPSSWALSGATSRVSSLKIFSYDAGTTITGNAGIPTTIQTGPTGSCSPYTYASSMGDCAAHTGYAGCVDSVTASSTCHMEIGMSGACGYPSYSCLHIAP